MFKHAITGHTTPDGTTAVAPYIYRAHWPARSPVRAPGSDRQSPAQTGTDRARPWTVGRPEIRRVWRAWARTRSDFRRTAGHRFTAGRKRTGPTADSGGARRPRRRPAPDRRAHRQMASTSKSRPAARVLRSMTVFSATVSEVKCRVSVSVGNVTANTMFVHKLVLRYDRCVVWLLEYL